MSKSKRTEAGTGTGNFGYDGAGNLTYLTPFGISYDAENRQKKVMNGGVVVAEYVYDGEGRRVERTANGTTTAYLYDATGEVASEYVWGTPAGAAPCATCYVGWIIWGARECWWTRAAGRQYRGMTTTRLEASC